MTLEKVSNCLNVTERTIHRLAVARHFSPFGAGGGWRFSKADFEAWNRDRKALKKAN